MVGGGCAPNARVVVVKVGGSVLNRGSDYFAAAEAALARAPPGSLVLVVSAMRGVTDLLIEASRGDLDAFNAACYRMIDAALEVGGKELAGEAAERCSEKRGLAGSRDPYGAARLVALGEEVSSLVLRGALSQLGVEAASLMGGDAGISAEGDPFDAAVDMSATSVAVQGRLKPLLERGVVPVVAGYTGVDPEGRLVLLGRGGSDVSAVVLGSALRADRVVMLTEAGGLLTGDPRLVKSPRLLERVSLWEALEAARLGLRKFHPRTFDYVTQGLSLEVSGVSSPRGTIIDDRDSGRPVKMVVVNRGFTLLELAGLKEPLDALAARLAGSGYRVAALEAPPGGGSALLAVEGPWEGLVEATRQAAARVKAFPGLASVALVGYGAGRPAALKAALDAAGGSEPLAVFRGAYSLGLLVPDEGAVELARSLHESLVVSGPWR